MFKRFKMRSRYVFMGLLSALIVFFMPYMSAYAANSVGASFNSPTVGINGPTYTYGTPETPESTTVYFPLKSPISVAAGQTITISVPMSGTDGGYMRPSLMSSSGAQISVLDTNDALSTTIETETYTWSNGGSSTWVIGYIGVTQGLGLGTFSITGPITANYTSNLPSAPNGLTANVSGTSVTLSWSSVTTASSYDVFLDGSSTPYATGITGTTHTISGLSGNAQYSATVAAVNVAGIGPQSNTATFLINVMQPPTGLKETGSTIDSINLSWNSVGNASSYYILEGGTQIATVTGTSSQVTGLSPQQTYKFSVESVGTDANGNLYVSPASTALSANTADLQRPVVTVTSETDTTGNISWSTVSGANGYEILVNGQQVGTTTGTTYQITGLSASTSYTVNVVATFNPSSGPMVSSPESYNTTLTTAAPPPVPKASVTVAQVTTNSGTATITPGPNTPPNTTYVIYANGQPVATITPGESLTNIPIPNWNPNTVYTVGATAPGYSASTSTPTGGVITSSGSWGFQATDIFSNTASLIASLGSILLLILVVIFSKKIVAFLRFLFRGRSENEHRGGAIVSRSVSERVTSTTPKNRPTRFDYERLSNDKNTFIPKKGVNVPIKPLRVNNETYKKLDTIRGEKSPSISSSTIKTDITTGTISSSTSTRVSTDLNKPSYDFDY